MMRFTKLKCEEVCQLYMQSWSRLIRAFPRFERPQHRTLALTNTLRELGG
jgi:hypothetical protein